MDRWNGDERVKQVVLAAEAFENYWKKFPASHRLVPHCKLARNRFLFVPKPLISHTATNP